MSRPLHSARICGSRRIVCADRAILVDMSNRLTGRQRYGYAVGSFGTGGFATVPGLVLLFT